MSSSGEVENFIEQFYREKWRETIAVLTRRFGTEKLDDIENAIQRAIEKALSRWRVSGLPKNPGGWLYTVAKNDLLDDLRRQRRIRENRHIVTETIYSITADAPSWFGPLDDDVLRMILVCCHPRLKARESVAITLRYICGLKPPDIAGVLLLTEVGARKLLTRTKDKIRNRPIPFELPESDARKERLARVLQIIYLLFAEGYAANAGDQLVRRDLCEEAIRLCDLLQKTEETAVDGRVWALAALMRFQAARLPARSNAAGHLVLLAEQDRRLWDQRQISEAFAYLSRAIEGTQRSRYHLEAAIAACHATAADYEHTDWPRILSFYDDLALLAPSPVVALNRAVAVMMIDGPEMALEQLRPLEADRKLKHYPLLTSVLADFHRRAGHIDQAEDYYRHALELTKNLPLKRFLSDQLNSLSIA